MKGLSYKRVKQSGVTFVELMIGVALLVGLMIAIGTFMTQTYELRETSYASLTVADEARKLLRPMTNEIRSAVPSSLGAYALESVGTSEIVFFSDSDQDGLAERIRYYLDSGNLVRGEIIPTGTPLQYVSGNETTQTLIRDVTSLTFTYFDENYDGTSDPLSSPFAISEVRLVRIGVAIDNDPSRDPSPLAVLETEVSIRNLKGNL